MYLPTIMFFISRENFLYIYVISNIPFPEGSLLL